MTRRQVLLQAGLAAAALVLAYLTWQRGPELAQDEAFALDIAKNDLVSVRFDDQEKKTWVELSRASDDNGAFVSVNLGPQDKPAKPKPPTPPGTKAPEQPVEKTPARRVRGNETAERLLASFTPLRADRSLGILDAAKLKELGLDAAKKRITLTLSTGKRTFTIVPAPPGGTLPYLRDEASKQVYVVARSFLFDFQSAASVLVERKTHGFRLEDIDHIHVTLGSLQRDFIVTRSEGTVKLAAASTPDKPEQAVKTWHSKLFGLWPTEILGAGEVPAEGAPQVALRIDYSARGRRLGFIELGKVAAIASTTNGAQDVLYARSEHTLGWVKLGNDTKTLLGDAQSLFK
jgi:hypothetical protein